MKLDSEKLWYTKNILSTLLLPLSWIFRLVVFFRRIFYTRNISNSELEDVCVIVVGNITVGGTGKTPFVSYITKRFLSHGIKVGIISRGYKRHENNLVEVLPDSNVESAGDEALMLKHQTSCPVVVATSRFEAASYLKEKYKPDVIISDDGLQHYKLPRNIEIVIVDGEREFGNGRCLPAGPLREPVSRLKSSDIVVCNGENQNYEYQYSRVSDDVVSLKKDVSEKSLESFRGATVHAIAGIGHPKRFFTMLENAGIKTITHPFDDHHYYSRSDIEFNDDLPIFMTEKDAVKCMLIAKENTWYVPMSIVPNEKLDERLAQLIEDIR